MTALARQMVPADEYEKLEDQLADSEIVNSNIIQQVWAIREVVFKLQDEMGRLQDEIGRIVDQLEDVLYPNVSPETRSLFRDGWMSPISRTAAVLQTR